jgi:hypothetical protein
MLSVASLPCLCDVGSFLVFGGFSSPWKMLFVSYCAGTGLAQVSGWGLAAHVFQMCACILQRHAGPVPGQSKTAQYKNTLLTGRAWQPNLPAQSRQAPMGVALHNLQSTNNQTLACSGTGEGIR